MKEWNKLTVEIWSQIVEKLTAFGLGNFEKNIAKKYHKKQFALIFLWTLRPKLAILLKFLRPCQFSSIFIFCVDHKIVSSL